MSRTAERRNVIQIGIRPNPASISFSQEMRHLDISHVRDIRTGKEVRVPKDPKLREMLSLGPGDLEDKTVTVVYSTDFVSVNFVNFCTRKTDVAKVCQAKVLVFY